jgi:UDP-2,3-diacylglucosamine pyrophosphatase LpxH
MKVAIITDQHFGARKNSKLFHDYFLKFYNDVFFPTLEEHGITTVVDMGDTFDSRKGIDFSALSWAKNNYYDSLQEMGVKVHTIVGNHTAYYKNTNQVNAVDLLLREYDNVTVYSEPTEVMLGNFQHFLYLGLIKKMKQILLNLLKRQLARVRWGTLSSRDLELINKSSWSTVWRANYLRSSNVSTRDTITLDRITEQSSI